MLKALFTFLAAISALVAQFFGQIVGAEKLQSLGLEGSSRWVNQHDEGASLAQDVPADAHVATASELKELRSGTWRSVARPTNTSISFGGYVSDMENGYVNSKNELEEFGDNVPADLQQLSGYFSCNIGFGFVWFEDSVLRLSKYGISTKKACSPIQDKRNAELVSFLAAKPTVYLDGSGIMYLKRPDGKAAAFKR